MSKTAKTIFAVVDWSVYLIAWAFIGRWIGIEQFGPVGWAFWFVFPAANFALCVWLWCRAAPYRKLLARLVNLSQSQVDILVEWSAAEEKARQNKV